MSGCAARYGLRVDRARVAVVYGGRSSEHSISCVSAGSILEAIDRDRYEPIAIGIDEDGRWSLQDGDPAALRIRDGRLPVVVPRPGGARPSPIPGGGIDGLGGVDVVFPVLHGPNGEDGTIQGLLELVGLPYVGSGVLASSVAMDKGAMKAMFRAAGLPIGPFEVVTDRQWRTDRPGSLARAAALGSPLFVKPVRAGSSRGISKVRDDAELEAAMALAREHDPRIIIEAAIEGVREIECGVLVDASGRAMASRCAEIVVHGHDFYDFEAKYLDDSAELIVPADLAPDLEAWIQTLAIEAFEALGCEGLARVDFFVTDDGGVVLNEVNTMPGFTPISMFPRAWQASGLPYADLITHLVEDARRRGTGLR